MTERTLCVIKPDAVSRNRIGAIVKAFEDEKLKVVSARMTLLERSRAEEFYAEHAGKDFFDRLIEFMTSGPVLALVLEGEDAVGRARKVMGATNPADAAPGTLRAMYGESVTKNAIHGSDSPRSAVREIDFYFGGEGGG